MLLALILFFSLSFFKAAYLINPQGNHAPRQVKGYKGSLWAVSAPKVRAWDAMGPIPEHCITFQQDISKPYFMNLVLNSLDLEKSTNHGQGYIAKLGEGFPPTSVHGFLVLPLCFWSLLWRLGLHHQTLLLRSVFNWLPDSRASWVPVSVSQMLFFSPRPGKPTSCRVQSEITFRSGGESRPSQPLPPTVGSTTGTQVCIVYHRPGQTILLININKQPGTKGPFIFSFL